MMRAAAPQLVESIVSVTHVDPSCKEGVARSRNSASLTCLQPTGHACVLWRVSHNIG